MKREKLETYLGANVEIVLFNGEIIKGEFHKTGEEMFRNNTYLFLNKNRYFCTNALTHSTLFKSSYVVKIRKRW